MEMSPLALEKPQNGIAGLKHWRHDLLAGLVVSLVSLPFSLGIAVASGAPAICGLISAIIAGLILPFLGGSYVTISGPAAGLAPALFAAMILLGRGNREVGYPLLLGAICLTGLVQVVLARFKLARFCTIFPASVVEGMLAAIGLLIIAKQLPLILGHKFEAHEFWGIVGEAPSQFLRMDPKVFFVGFSCLALIFALGALKMRWVKIVPPQVIAAAVGVALGWALGLSGDSLIQIPDQPFKHGITVPNFRGLFGDQSLWWALFVTVVTLTLIDGVESLATIAAIDKIDPFRRKSDPDRTLNAMGISNMASSLAGGLTIIPGGVKSTTAILSGARTQWANFYNALFLIAYLLMGRGLINLIPLSALGAIVLFTGYKLCAPKVWKHAAHIGGEQLLVFATTVLVTVTTDLLWGIAAGVGAKLLLEFAIVARAERGTPGGHESPGQAVSRRLGEAGELFRDPLIKAVEDGPAYHMYFGRPMVCFNTLHIGKDLAAVPAGATSVTIHVTDMVTLMDHTATTMLLDFVEEFERSGRGVASIVGLDKLRARSGSKASMRIGEPILARERSEVLAGLAKLDPTREAEAATGPLADLDQVRLTRVEPTPSALARGGRLLALKGKAGLAKMRGLGGGATADDPADDLVWYSLNELEAKPSGPDGLAWFSLKDPEPKPSGRDDLAWISLGSAQRRVGPPKVAPTMPGPVASPAIPAPTIKVVSPPTAVVAGADADEECLID